MPVCYFNVLLQDKKIYNVSNIQLKCIPSTSLIIRITDYTADSLLISSKIFNTDKLKAIEH
jgi:hypothetical protein